MSEKQVPERVRRLCEATENLTFNEMSRVAEVLAKKLGARSLSHAKIALALSQTAKELNDASHLVWPDPTYAEDPLEMIEKGGAA